MLQPVRSAAWPHRNVHQSSGNEVSSLLISNVGTRRTSCSPDSTLSGYAVTNHSTATAQLLHQFTDHISSISQFVSKRPPKNAPNDDCMRFQPIFQRAPTRYLDPNIGDGKRSSCVGLPAGRDAIWCQFGSSVAMSIISDIDLALASSESLSVLENSVLATEPGAHPQIGHFDLQVSAPPDSGSVPAAIIMVTPLDRDTSLRILPMDSLDRIPTLGEFERLCIEVHVRVGQTLLMRHDMAHGGSSCPGKRLHSVVGPSRLVNHKLGDSFLLRHKRVSSV